MVLDSSIKVVLLDIEGTTTSISFVHDVLFPYAKSKLPNFVSSNLTDKNVLLCLQATIDTVYEEQERVIDTDEAVKTLLAWIKIDRKHSALKTLQGLIWRDGYESGQYTAHVYDDVLANIRRWFDMGIKIAIYSSGSVEAQKLLFKYTSSGDLTSYISNYFDLAVGRKDEAASYLNVIKVLDVDASQILFLSDSETELDAANSVKIVTKQVLRSGTAPCDNHPKVENFENVLS